MPWTGAAANETVIPSESSVTAAKEKRERLRANKPATTSNGEDFISLSVTRRAEEWQGPHPESRLMREDDDLGEGDDGMHSCFGVLYLLY